MAAAAQVKFSFEGREIGCNAGISLAAALTGAAEFDLRHTAENDSRGVFCGMGVCQECRVNIDGKDNVRACMTTVQDGMVVSRG